MQANEHECEHGAAGVDEGSIARCDIVASGGEDRVPISGRSEEWSCARPIKEL